MRRQSPFAQLLLRPFSCLYGIVTAIRNKAFDFGLLKSHTFNIPIINIGNITVGGTGKTPHIEYVIELLKEETFVATLSRGYKRKSKGFKIASNPPSAIVVGDEPAQIKSKFNTIVVAVDADRRNGISKLLEISTPNKIQTILLDDAYQHRYVKAGLNILLIDYNRSIFKDKMLPAGDLREYPSGIKRADIIIITKCTDEISIENELSNIRNHKHITNQKIFFSRYRYQNLITIQTKQEHTIHQIINKETSVLILSGIASPKPLINYITEFTAKIEIAQFNDHHNFTTKELQELSAKFESINNSKKIIITTEKDTQRIIENELPESLLKNTYYLPIKVDILNNDESELIETIKNYVRTNKRDI